ncbi:MAG: hypothetical protein EA369_00150, partial [Bradymonadales bacterium]
AFFHPASTTKFSVPTGEASLRSFEISGDNNYLLAALAGPHSGQVALLTMKLVNHETGELAPEQTEALILPLKRDSLILRARPESSLVWALDGSNRIFLVGQTEEGALEAAGRIFFTQAELEAFGLIDSKITDLRFFPSGRGGLFELSNSEGKRLVAFSLGESEEDLQLQIFPDFSLALPSDSLGWEIHPDGSSVVLLRSGNNFEFWTLGEEGDLSLAYQQKLDIGVYEAKHFNFYHDVDFRVEKTPKGKRTIAFGPYRIAVQAKHPDHGGQLRVIWLKVGSGE